MGGRGDWPLIRVRRREARCPNASVGVLSVDPGTPSSPWRRVTRRIDEKGRSCCCRSLGSELSPSFVFHCRLVGSVSTVRAGATPLQRCSGPSVRLSGSLAGDVNTFWSQTLSTVGACDQLASWRGDSGTEGRNDYLPSSSNSFSSHSLSNLTHLVLVSGARLITPNSTELLGPRTILQWIQGFLLLFL